MFDEITLSLPSAATRFADAHPVCDEEFILKVPIIFAALAFAALPRPAR